MTGLTQQPFGRPRGQEKRPRSRRPIEEELLIFCEKKVDIPSRKRDENPRMRLRRELKKSLGEILTQGKVRARLFFPYRKEH